MDSAIIEHLLKQERKMFAQELLIMIYEDDMVLMEDSDIVAKLKEYLQKV